MTTLRGARVVLRQVVEGDVRRLLEILREPEVALHWTEPDDGSELLLDLLPEDLIDE